MKIILIFIKHCYFIVQSAITSSLIKFKNYFFECEDYGIKDMGLKLEFITSVLVLVVCGLFVVGTTASRFSSFSVLYF